MLHRVLLFLVCALPGLCAAERSVEVSISLQRSASGTYQFFMRNTGAAPVFYTGYGLAESASPVYGIEVWRRGKWVEARMGWCGTGMVESLLRAKAGVTAEVYPDHAFRVAPGEKFRIAMRFETERYFEGKKDAWVTVYSNAATFTPGKR